MAEHLGSWYKFVNETMELEVGNGELRLVIGCDKAPLWGMAALSNFSQTSNQRLKFCSLDRNARQLTGSAYIWEHAGTAKVKVGPSTRETDLLGATDDQPLYNQALFLRTLNHKFSDEKWAAIHQFSGQALPAHSQALESSNSAGSNLSSTSTSGRQVYFPAATSTEGRSTSGSGPTPSDEADLRGIYHEASIAMEHRKVRTLCIPTAYWLIQISQGPLTPIFDNKSDALSEGELYTICPYSELIFLAIPGSFCEDGHNQRPRLAINSSEGTSLHITLFDCLALLILKRNPGLDDYEPRRGVYPDLHLKGRTRGKRCVDKVLLCPCSCFFRC